MVMIFGIFASMDLLIANANRGDSTQWVHYSHLNVNWFLEMSLLLSLHITLLFDQSLSESSRWILSISAFIAGVSLIGFFFAPILTERFVYYPFILFAYIMSDVVQPDLNKMRALTIACLMSLGVIMLYDFLRFTLDSDFSRTFHSIL
jgi:hypothetical protein